MGKQHPSQQPCLCQAVEGSAAWVEGGLIVAAKVPRAVGVPGLSDRKGWRWLGPAIGGVALMATAPLIFINQSSTPSSLDAPDFVEVEYKVVEESLSLAVVARGTVAPQSVMPVSLMTTSGQSSVTTGPSVGSIVDDGDVVLEVWGRPVIALEGPLPLTRSLWPTIKGPDVRQLEDALERLGLLDDADDTVDFDTVHAVELLYQRLGVEPPDAPAERYNDVVSAERALTEAHATRDSLLERGVAADSARTTERGQLEREIRDRLADLEQHGLASESSRISAERLVATTISSLAAALDCTGSAAAGTCIDQEIAVEKKRLAEISLRQLELSILQAETLLQEQLDAVRIRLAALEASQRGIAGLDDALGAHGEAHDLLDEALARRDGWISADEFIFVPDLPATLLGPDISVGADSAKAELLQFGSTELHATVSIPAFDGSALRVGMAAKVKHLLDGGTATATIDQLLDSAEGTGRLTVSLGLDVGHGLSAGDAVVVTIPIAESLHPVPVVPVVAVSLNGAGEPTVHLKHPSGSVERVIVELGLQSEGLVEVLDSRGRIRAGDLVVVWEDRGP